MTSRQSLPRFVQQVLARRIDIFPGLFQSCRSRSRVQKSLLIMSMDKISADQILWVKCGPLFWPGEIWPESKWDKELKEDILAAKKPPLHVVKFFNEDGYEFLYDMKNAFPYNCDRKEEFIRKGIVKSRAKSKEGATGGWFQKFPKDIVLCEERIGGDPHLLEKDPFVEKNERINYKEVFGTPEDAKKRKDSAQNSSRKRKSSPSKKEPPNKRPIVHPRFQKGRTSDHQVKMMPQPSSPYHLDLIKSQEKEASADTSRSSGNGIAGTPGNQAGSGRYSCHVCGFSASRLNVIILHNKSHSEPAPSSTKSKPNAKATTTPSKSKTATASTPAPADSSPKRRGRPRATPSTTPSTTPKAKKANKANKDTPTKPAAKSTPAPTKPPVKEPKKPSSPVKRKTKKEQKLKETERKKEERKKILGDWSEEEEGEAEEKKKLKDVLEETFADSSDEEVNDDWMMEDNVQGNVYDGEEDEEEAPKPKQEEKSKEPQKKVEEAKPEEEKDKQDEFEFDIGKVLEETAVPKLPSVSDFKKTSAKARKSVSFAEKPKEIVQKSIALVQAESNLDAPPLVDDDFDEFVNDYPLPDSPPKVYTPKRILKSKQKAEEDQEKQRIIEEPSEQVIDQPRPSESQQEEDPKQSENVQKAPPDEMVEPTEDEEKEAEKKPPMASKATSLASDWAEEEEEETPLDHLANEASKLAEAQRQQEVGEAEAQEIAVVAAAATPSEAKEGGEETYLILMDDGTGTVDNLNSQTLYIDSSQLENGELSNMVLMTDDGVALNAQTVTAANTAPIPTAATPSESAQASTASKEEAVSSQE